MGVSLGILKKEKYQLKESKPFVDYINLLYHPQLVPYIVAMQN